MSEKATGVTPGIGHNRTPEDRRAEFIAAITQYVIEVREVEGMSIKDLALLSDKQRIGALQNGHLISTIRLCRANGRMDAILAVRDLIFAMADMQQRCCLLSAAQIGKVLNRNERNIRSCLDRLVADKIIGRLQKPGRYNAHYPIVDKRLALEPASPDWIIQAFVPGALKGGRVEDDFIIENQDDRNPGYEHPAYPGREHPGSKTNPGRRHPGLAPDPGREHPVYPPHPGYEHPGSEPQVACHPGCLHPTESSIVMEYRDSPLTPPLVERGVRGENHLDIVGPLASPSASPREVSTTKVGSSAQKSKPATVELFLEPIGEEVVEAEVLNPDEYFGAVSAQPSGPVRGPRGKKPKRPGSHKSGKHPFFSLTEEERREVCLSAQTYGVERGWPIEFIRDRVREFIAHQKSRKPFSLDWMAEMELWMGYKKPPTVAPTQGRAEAFEEAAASVLKNWKERKNDR